MKAPPKTLHELVAAFQNALQYRFGQDTRNLFSQNVGLEIKIFNFAAKFF